MTHAMPAEGQILRTRIRFELRCATGVVFDIDAMLRTPELREKRIRIWHDVGSSSLSRLLDQLESEFQEEQASAAAEERPGSQGRQAT